MKQLRFDELNILGAYEAPRSMPIEQWFGEMNLSESEKKTRISFATALMALVFTALTRIYVYKSYGYEDLSAIDKDLTEQFLVLIDDYTVLDNPIRRYVRRYVRRLIDTTIAHLGDGAPSADSYWLSEDRARLNAENETNSVFNYDEFRIAKANGYKYKTWVTMGDERVRPAHVEVEGLTIPIDEYFHVGNSLLAYPRDFSMDPDPDDVVNCRCTLTYS